MIDKPKWHDIAGTLPEVAAGDEPKEELQPLAIELERECDHIDQQGGERMRRNNMIYDLELYYGMRLGSLYDVSLGKYDAQDWQPENLTYNLIFGLCQAVSNWVCSFNPRADMTPDNGDYKLIRGAKMMRQSCDAWMREENIYEERSFAFRDVLTSDAGIIKIFDDGEKVNAARFPSWEFKVSEDDGRYRRPQCIYHDRWISLQEALDKYGGTEAKDQLIRLGAKSDIDGIAYSSTTSCVREIDAYKRGPDGRHVIQIGRYVARNDAWKWDGHPMVIKRFDWKSIGFWGVSGINSIRGVQLAMNDHTESVDDAHRMTSHQILQCQENDSPMQQANDPTRVYKFKQTPMVVTNPPPVGTEAYKYIELLRDIAYETWGVPRNLSQGMKPAGANSGIAIRESVEVKSDRISRLTKINEEFITETADWWRKLSNELPARKWRVLDRGMMATIKMPMLGDNIAVSVLPTSLFGTSVSGRIDKAFDLVDRKILDEEDALRAVDVPDLDPITNLRLAEANLREQIVDDILQDNVCNWPSEYMDPVKMAEYAKKRYFAALVSKVNFPQENLDLLTKLIDAEITRAKAAMAPPPAPPGPPMTPSPGAGPAQLQPPGAPPQPFATNPNALPPQPLQLQPPGTGQLPQ